VSTKFSQQRVHHHQKEKAGKIGFIKFKTSPNNNKKASLRK
jgi:hypothetical protein